jgi:hypothetical protein
MMRRTNVLNIPTSRAAHHRAGAAHIVASLKAQHQACKIAASASEDLRVLSSLEFGVWFILQEYRLEADTCMDGAAVPPIDE